MVNLRESYFVTFCPTDARMPIELRLGRPEDASLEASMYCTKEMGGKIAAALNQADGRANDPRKLILPRKALERCIHEQSETITRLQREISEYTKTKPTCQVCNWSNSNTNLNLGDPGGEPIWMCHGCIKRANDKLRAISAIVLAPPQ